MTNSQIDKSLDEIDNILFEAIESAASYTHQVTAEEADYIQSVARQSILALKQKWEREARIDEANWWREQPLRILSAHCDNNSEQFDDVSLEMQNRIKELGDK